MTEDDDIVKSTLRYDKEMEKNLEKAFAKSGFKTMNKFINHLLNQSLFDFPQEVTQLQNQIKSLTDDLRQAHKEKGFVEGRFDQLKELIQQRNRVEEVIANLISKEPIQDGKGGAYSKLAYSFFETNKLSFSREELNGFSKYLIDNDIEKPSMIHFNEFKKSISNKKR